MPKTHVTIRIGPAHGDRFDAIVHALEAAGLSAVERHERFLMVNGVADADALDALRKVGGVASVREDRDYKTQ